MTTAPQLDWSRALVLTAAAFEAGWEILGLGETPWQLEPPRQGSTAAARQAFVADVLARLRDAGSSVAEKLQLLARPAWTVDVRLRADRLVAAVAACRGAEGVLAVRCGDEMALMDIPAADAVAAVLSLLGPVHPGPDPPALITIGLQPVPAQMVSACRDVRMFAQLGASVAACDGHRMRRAPRVIGFYRTGAGDYRSVRVDLPAVTVEPATPARLTTDYRSVRVDLSAVVVEPATLIRLTADLDELLAVDPYSGLAGRGSM